MGSPENSKKRHLGSPSGTTPGKPAVKTVKRDSRCSSRKALFPKSLENNILENSRETNVIDTKVSWSKEEISSLVEYIALYHDSNSEKNCWPAHKNFRFWDACAKAVSEKSRCPIRTGNACRRKVQNYLQKNFNSINEAEKFYGIDYFGQSCPASTPSCPTENLLLLSPALQNSPNPRNKHAEASGDSISKISKAFPSLTSRQKVQLLSHLFAKYLTQDIGLNPSFLPPDFIELTSSAMKTLQDGGKENTVYHLSKSLCDKRDDGSSRMPIDRMPFGLIAYNLKFFSVKDVNNIHASEDYMEWQTTMFAHFRNKWDKLYRGPMWSFDNDTDDKSVHEVGQKDDVDVLSKAISETFGENSIPISCEINTMPDDKDTSLSEEHSPCQISTLWSGLSSSEREELQDSQTHLDDIAHAENIVPTYNRTNKTIKRDPMTVKKSELKISNNCK